MVHRILAGAFALLISSVVFGQAPQSSPAISYTRDIQPIFTEKCVACHACNDAACQLKLESPEGAVRGASKVPVYEATAARRCLPRGCSTTPIARSNGARKAFTRCSTTRAARPR